MAIQQTIAARSAAVRKPGPAGRPAPAGTDHWTVLNGLLPFVWPGNRPDLRLRVAAAFAVLIAAKLVTVSVPIFLKGATDWLAGHGALPSDAISVPEGLGIAAVALILAYGAGRILIMVLNQVRDVFFTKVGQNAVRELNNRTFQHLHRLSLRFHLERRTGG